MKWIGLLLAAARYARTWLKCFLYRRYLTHGVGIHIGGGGRIWAPRHVVLGNQVYIGTDVHIEANCRIGNYCLVANRVAIVGRHDHDYSRVGVPVRFSPWIGSYRDPSPYVNEEAVIEDDVWIGFGAIILTGVVVGRGSVIAAGSVVAKDIPPYSIAAGAPAKVVGYRFEGKEAIDLHERGIRSGEFRFSERGYDQFIIKPGH